MNFSAPFIHRPVATTLLMLSVLFAGFLAYFQLPVAPLPNIELPTIQVTASLPGASPETMATTVATPLERRLGLIAGVTEMTSYSSPNRCNSASTARSTMPRATCRRRSVPRSPTFPPTCPPRRVPGRPTPPTRR